MAASAIPGATRWCNHTLWRLTICESRSSPGRSASRKSLSRQRSSQKCRKSAGDESRTRDLNVGNVALYQLSYSRVASRIIASVDLAIGLIRTPAELGVTSASRLRHAAAGKAVRLRRYHWQDGSEGDRLPLARGWGGGGQPFSRQRPAGGRRGP